MNNEIEEIQGVRVFLYGTLHIIMFPSDEHGYELHSIFRNDGTLHNWEEDMEELREQLPEQAWGWIEDDDKSISESMCNFLGLTYFNN